MAEPAPDRGGLATAVRWAPAALTIALLAVTSSRTIGLASNDGGDAPVHLVASFQPGRDSVFRNRDLWVNSIIIDGTRARLVSGAHMTGWDVVTRWGAGMPAWAEYRDTVPVATMRLTEAPDAAVIETWNWPGDLLMRASEADLATLDLRAVRGQIVAGRELTTQIPVLVISALSLLVLAMRTGATAPGRRVAWLAITLTTWHACFWLSQPVGTTTDSQGYLDSFTLLMSTGLPSYFPPGYPLLVGLGERIAGEWAGLALTAVQHALAVGTGLMAYLLMRRLVAEGAAWWTGALSGGLPAVVTMSHTIMSEVPAMFAMVGTAYFAIRAREQGRVGSAVCCGLLAGWAILTRVVPIVALLPAITVIYLLPKAGRAIRPLIGSLATAAFVVLAPVVLFWSTAGSPRLTVSTGFHLFNRIVTEQRQIAEGGEATRELVARFGADPRGLAFWDVAKTPGFRDLRESDAERLFARVALEGILEDPWAYIRSTPPLAWREYRSDPTGWIPRWGETPTVLPHFENPPLGGVTATSIRWRLGADRAHRIMWPVIAWAALAGAIVGVRSHRRVVVLALAWIPMAYLYASASVEYFAPRHNVPVIPFVVMLTGIGADWLITRAQRAPIFRRGA